MEVEMERIDPALLGRLRFVTRRRRRGGWGERRSTRRGQGLEFADYRDYVPGDDLRRVDWNLYARLDRPYVRLYEEEADLHVHLLLDGSASMDWAADGTLPSRWAKAKALALALGTVALLNGEALGAAMLREGHVEGRLPRLRGRAALPRWESWVAQAKAGGTTALGAALRTFVAGKPRAGLVLLLSDAYDPGGLEAGLKALASAGHEVILLHLLTPQELEPPLWGEVRLVDVESGAAREVTVDRAAQEAYLARLRRWQEELRGLLGRYGGRYVVIRSDLPLQKVVLEGLRRAGILR